MPILKDTSLKQKLIKISLVTAGFALLMSALALSVNEVFVFKRALLNALITQTEIIGNNCTAALTFNDAKTAGEVLSALKANRGIRRASIYTRDGLLFAEFKADGNGPALTDGLKKEGYRFGLTSVEIYHDIVFEKEIIGQIHIHSDLNELYANLLRHAAVFLIAILFSLCAVYVMSARLYKTITGLISDLVHTMSTVSEKKDYSVRAAVKGKDELGAMAEGFNEMLVQVQSRDAELEAYRKNLEELVDRRTRQLQTANEQLRNELTERNKIEEALRKSEEFNRYILETVDEGFIVVDRNYRILSANEAFCRSVKLAEEQILGRYCYELSHHFNKPCHESGEDCAVRQTFERGEPFALSHTHVGEDGEKSHVEIKSYPIRDALGNVVSAIETITDVTEKKKLEEQLRHAQKLEALGTLAGGVAHDFNNILNVIVGYGGMMEMHLAKDDPYLPYLREILAASERATHLTQALLIFSRKQIAELKPIHINELVSGMKKMVFRIIGEDIETNISLSPENMTIMGDYGQLEQVLMNFATNARDAMPDGGALSIDTLLFEMDTGFIHMHGFGKPGKYALVAVSDTGKGMDEHTCERIFEPFFTTKGLGKGTGLGLSIVYGIIKQHNGFINCYSEPERGTIFKIYLPLINDEVIESEEAEIGSEQGGTETILIVDDDEHIRKLTKVLLENHGYTVIEARDGSEAVHFYRENRDKIQLVLLDVIMPRKSGKEAFEEIRAIQPDIKALFMSGYTEDVIQRKKIIEEKLPFLQKPVRPRVLLTNIRDMLDGKQG